MNLLTRWIRAYLPPLEVDDRQLAEDLTLRGIAVEGEFAASCGGSRFEMDITTNRVDAMNHYGVAREVAAMYGVALKPLSEVIDEIGVAPSSTVLSSMSGREQFPIRIEAEDLCGRFTARVIRGVTVAAATGEIAEYFAALGQKPISAAVDATNFGWLAMGQPTHVFDLDKLEGGIAVRRARAGERLKLLDGSEHVLVADDLVVADEKKALGLAGVMGGWDSRVTEATKNILVEAAWFDPAAVRASSRRHGLHTDASHRFERGADFNAAPLANDLVTRLVIAQCGGEVVGKMTDVVVEKWQSRTAKREAIALSLSEVRRILGPTTDGSGITGELVERYLSALGCVVAAHSDGEYNVTLPSWRLDLERAIDLIEEIARVFGYNKFAGTLPTFAGTVIELPHALAEQTIRETLRGLGYSEAVSSTFVAASESEVFGEANGAVAMENPLSAEAGMLRPSLAPGMATMLAHNLHRDVSDVRLFEMGTVFSGSTATVDEAMGLALGATSATTNASALHSAADALFYEVKGAIEALLAKFAGTISFDAQTLPQWIAAGRGARVLLDGNAIGVFGELSATEMQQRKLRQMCVAGTVRADVLLRTPLRAATIQELSRFQSVERDFSFVFPDSVRWQSVVAAIEALGISELRRVLPIEVFRDAKGKAVAAGSYSLLLRSVFQAADRTLTENDLAGYSERIVAALTALGGTQRA